MTTKKDDLWKDVSKYLKGLYTPTEAEKRWNYLKDCYRKARNMFKKLQSSEKRSGAASKPKNEEIKPSFRHYNAMNFLDNVLEHRQTVASLKNTVPDVQASTSTDITAQSISLSNDNSSDNVFNEFINNSSTDNDIRPHSVCSISTNTSDSLQMSSESKKKKRSSGSTEYEQILIETLKQSVQPCPIEGFMLRLAEGMRKLPYKERSKLELEFLSRLREVEEKQGLLIE